MEAEKFSYIPSKVQILKANMGLTNPALARYTDYFIENVSKDESVPSRLKHVDKKKFIKQVTPYLRARADKHHI